MSILESVDFVSSFDDPELFINRESSLVRFHRRVLSLAEDPAVPLLERLRFLTITSAILDEFFEIRMGGLKEQVAFGISKPGPDGWKPAETMRRVREQVLELVEDQYRTLNDELLPALADRGIFLLARNNWPPEVSRWVKRYFRRQVLPVLTPMGLDPSHPFPQILNKSLNFIVLLKGKDAFGRTSRTAVVQAPRILPRVIRLPEKVSGNGNEFVMLSSIIHAHVGELFPGMKVLGSHQFRVTRNSDLWVDEEEVEDLLRALKGQLPSRHYGDAVRLELSHTCPNEMGDFLLEQFGLSENDLYRVRGPVNLSRLDAIYDLVDESELKYPTFIPSVPRQVRRKESVFDVLRERDVLVHHPYEGFGPVLELLRQAARDPDVLAIKQTVYRTGIESPLAELLLEAARAGKEVTAVVELRARFDEAANIELATKLQEAGAKVVYGVVGYKTHGKMMLIVRREGDGYRRYVHLGTGNYNPKTARQYVDVGLMTSDPIIGEDVHSVFMQLTSLGRAGALQKLVQTPFDFHAWLLQNISREEENARLGKKSRIVAKMNALIEPKVIKALYSASQAGVQVDLIVRGICCLRPGVPGVSDNIRVRSVLGRFLEHHRVFYFHADGEEEVWCSSADWMPRNFFRRVEVSFPVLRKKLRDRVVDECLLEHLADNCSAWDMQPDGSYVRATPDGSERRNVQERLLERLGTAGA